jgi:chromosome segregation ATPase
MPGLDNSIPAPLPGGGVANIEEESKKVEEESDIVPEKMEEAESNKDENKDQKNQREIYLEKFKNDLPKIEKIFAESRKEKDKINEEYLTAVKASKEAKKNREDAQKIEEDAQKLEDELKTKTKESDTKLAEFTGSIKEAMSEFMKKLDEMSSEADTTAPVAEEKEDDNALEMPVDTSNPGAFLDEIKNKQE